jgi:hypothetical protein
VPLAEEKKNFFEKGLSRGHSSRASNGKSSLAINNSFMIFLATKKNREASKKFIYSSTRLILKKSQSFLNAGSISASLLKIEVLSINLSIHYSKKVIRKHF